MAESSNRGFFSEPLSVASSFAKLYSKEELDLHTLWMAFLFLAKKGVEGARIAVNTYAPGVDLDSMDFLEVQCTPSLSLSSELLRFFGPLGLFAMSEEKACTAENFIPVIQKAFTSGLTFPKDAIPNNFTHDSQIVAGLLATTP